MFNQFFRYAFLGTVGTLVHYATLALLTAIQLNPIVATAIDAAAGSCTNFALCKKWVFITRDVAGLTSAMRFFTTASLTIFLNTTIMSMAVNTMGVWPAQFLATGISLPMGYCMNRWWTFQSAAGVCI